MKLLWAESAWSDYLNWQATDAAVTARIHAIIKDAKRDPFSGVGKPEPLKGRLAGCWSRRITQEHRFVYRVVGSGDAQVLEIVQCRYHY